MSDGPPGPTSEPPLLVRPGAEPPPQPTPSPPPSSYWPWPLLLIAAIVIFIAEIGVLGGVLLARRVPFGRLAEGIPGLTPIEPASSTPQGTDEAAGVLIEPTEGPRVTLLPTFTPQPEDTATPTDSPTPEPTVEPTLGAPINHGGAEMVYVPGGTFEMGSADQARTVTLSPFYIDRTEVTTGDWQACVAAGACTEPASAESYGGEPYYGEDAFARYPVTYVTWFDADGYCRWRGARLPTSAEWEMVARWNPDSGAVTVYPWGDTWDADRLNYCDASCPLDDGSAETDDGYPETAPVGSFPGGASAVGALDMAGNVAEWVADWYNGEPDPDDTTDPTGPAAGSERVVRGGAWGVSRPALFSMTNRVAYPPDAQGPGVGFRCAIDADDITEPDS